MSSLTCFLGLCWLCVLSAPTYDLQHAARLWSCAGLLRLRDLQPGPKGPILKDSMATSACRCGWPETLRTQRGPAGASSSIAPKLGIFLTTNTLIPAHNIFKKGKFRGRGQDQGMVQDKNSNRTKRKDGQLGEQHL